MAYCANCGGPLREDQRFCPNCGQSADPGRAGAPQGATPPPVPTPPAGAAPPPIPGAQYGAPGQQYPLQYPAGYGQGHQAPPPKRRTGLWIALAALLLAVIVACVLVFVVFYDDIFKGGGGSSPEATVSKMLDAMEDQDIDTVFSLMDQTVITDMFGEDFLDMAKDQIADEMFGGGSLKFSDIKMETEETSDTTATVTIVEGKVTMGDDGDEYTEEVSDADEPVTFDLVKKDGSWYIDPTTFEW
ncbi:MAG: hypothetical protein JW990_10910 [Thermoleophilia bacterium]|nr:hypothetical protein [Thermoleophilia bacterium]